MRRLGLSLSPETRCGAGRPGGSRRGSASCSAANRRRSSSGGCRLRVVAVGALPTHGLGAPQQALEVEIRESAPVRREVRQAASLAAVGALEGEPTLAVITHAVGNEALGMHLLLGDRPHAPGHSRMVEELPDGTLVTESRSA